MALLPIPRAVQKGCTGCSWPAVSRARLHSSWGPGVSTDHTQRHACQACALVGGSRSASAHVAPPFALTDTLSIVERPDHARPMISWLPRWTIRVRVRNSGVPGGISSERTRISDTGVPRSLRDEL